MLKLRLLKVLISILVGFVLASVLLFFPFVSPATTPAAPEKAIVEEYPITYPGIEHYEVRGIEGHGREVFKNHCSPCHDVIDTVVGPPLMQVFSRRDSVWIRNYILDAQRMYQQNDPIAVGLRKEHGGMGHPPYTSLPTADIDSLLVYLMRVDEASRL